MKLKTYQISKIKSGTRVLMRIDADVPLVARRVQEGKQGRLARVAPEIKRLARRGAKVILLGHLDRPGGKRAPEMSLKPVALHLSKLVGRQIKFIDELCGDQVAEAVAALKPGQILMLENIRFDAREQKNSAALAKSWASLADLYINNAFGTSHRRHASVVAITKYLPSYAGETLQNEIDQLSIKLTKPFMLVVGGAKLETKVAILEALAPKAEVVLLGGGISLPFLMVKYQNSLRLNGQKIPHVDYVRAKRLVDKHRSKIIFPVDLRVVSSGKIKEISARALTNRHQVIDIGPETEELYRRLLCTAGSIVWNGALGIVEKRGGEHGTLFVAKTIGAQSAHSILGGGDTVAFVEAHRLTRGIDFISTGGGAMLEYLADKKLPGLEALKR